MDELPLQVGMVLNDRYEVLDIIGKGAFGITYRAFDKKLNRDIALKVCFPADCCRTGGNGKLCPIDKEQYEKALYDMVNEARTLATIKHPRVVTIHDVEKCENVLYCIMEWVEGETLRARMDRKVGRVDESTARRWLEETLQALAYIHDKNIVHRDIKPANIIIRPFTLRVHVNRFRQSNNLFPLISLKLQSFRIFYVVRDRPKLTRRFLYSLLPQIQLFHLYGVLYL